MPLPLIMLIGAAVATLVALAAIHGARGSTAVPAAWWAVAACAALAIDAWMQWTGATAQPAAAARWRLVVCALAVCPTMSLLGAKRPQHGVWQLIVASLAAVMALPAASAWLVRPGSMPDVHLLGRVFLLVLLVVGWLNYVATARGPAATAIAAGQLVLLRPFLPGVAGDAVLPQPGLDAAGTLVIAAGALAALAQRRPGRRGDRPSPVAECIDPPFIALRDSLGAAWALRIAERFDAVATDRGWPCRLHFQGLDVGGDPSDTGWHRDALRAFRSLMRRFVDDAWLARHGSTGPSDRPMVPSGEGG